MKDWKKYHYFRRKYFNAYPRGNYIEYQLKEGAKEEIDRHISDICVSMKAEDYLDLKEPIVMDVYVELNKKEMELYKEMARKAIININDEYIPAVSAAAVQINYYNWPVGYL